MCPCALITPTSWVCGSINSFLSIIVPILERLPPKNNNDNNAERVLIRVEKSGRSLGIPLCDNVMTWSAYWMVMPVAREW